MLAMRNGVPCLVHHTGGLKDTVKHLETGFSFDGKTTDEKIKNMVDSFDLVLDLFSKDKTKWNKIKANAKKERFTWQKSLDDYYKLLYAITV
jgi:starch synthase